MPASNPVSPSAQKLFRCLAIRPVCHPLSPMKKLISLVVISAALYVPAFAAAEAEQTITGKAMCAKCELKQAEKCTNAIQVAGKDGKSTTYLMADNKVAKDFHGKVCKGTLEGVTVTGTVKKDGDKHIITASKIAAK